MPADHTPPSMDMSDGPSETRFAVVIEGRHVDITEAVGEAARALTADLRAENEALTARATAAEAALAAAMAGAVRVDCVAEAMNDLLGEARGIVPESADAFYDGQRGEFTAARILAAIEPHPAAQDEPAAQFLPTEDGEFNGNSHDIGTVGFGRILSFEPGYLRINPDGSGYFCVPDAEMMFEDDRGEGPDGPEGSIHWIAKMDASEIVALRDFLSTTQPQTDAIEPHPAAQDREALVAATLERARKVIASRRAFLNSQLEALDIAREDAVFAICEEIIADLATPAQTDALAAVRREARAPLIRALRGCIDTAEMVAADLQSRRNCAGIDMNAASLLANNSEALPILAAAEKEAGHD